MSAEQSLAGGPVWREPALWAAWAATNLATLPLVALPWVLARLSTDLGWSALQAGGASTLQLSLLAVSAIASGALAGRLPTRAVGASCTLMVVVLTAALAARAWPAPITLAALATIGLFSGMVNGVANALVARAAKPQQVVADMWAFTMLWQALFWFVAPRVSDATGLRGLMVLMAGASLLFLVLILGCGGARSVRGDDAPAGPSVERARPAATPWGLSTPLLLVGALTFWLRDGLLWSLVERRADMLGVTGEQLSWSLGVGAMLGIAGPLVVRLLDWRLGRATTVLLALLALGAVSGLIAGAGSSILYRSVFLLWASTSILAWLYVLKLALEADADGRLAGLACATTFVAAAASPLVAAWLLAQSVGALTAGSVALSVASVLLLVGAAGKLSQQHSARARGASPDRPPLSAAP